jgi:hypothetical protein
VHQVWESISTETLQFNQKVKQKTKNKILLIFFSSFLGNPNPVTFTLSGNFDVGSAMTLSGQLTSTWPDVFGAKWLTINSASATLNLGKISSSNALSINAQGTMTFNSQTDSLTINFQSGDDFTQFCFSGSVDVAWNVSGIIFHNVFFFFFLIFFPSYCGRCNWKARSYCRRC